LTSNIDVQLLATDPAYQRRGLATKLLNHVLDMADKQGKVSYLESTDAGWSVYRKLAYKEIDVLEIDLSKWGSKEVGRNRILLREPQPIS
jgi:GNAT superfamily N-acetyltransferase